MYLELCLEVKYVSVIQYGYCYFTKIPYFRPDRMTIPSCQSFDMHAHQQQVLFLYIDPCPYYEFPSAEMSRDQDPLAEEALLNPFQEAVIIKCLMFFILEKFSFPACVLSLRTRVIETAPQSQYYINIIVSDLEKIFIYFPNFYPFLDE